MREGRNKARHHSETNFSTAGPEVFFLQEHFTSLVVSPFNCSGCVQKAEVVEGNVGLVCRHRLDGGEMECSHRWSVILHRNCPSKCLMGLQTTHPLCRGE